MDNAELTRWKQLANDAVIACFGSDTREAQLATALERAVDILSETSNTCPRCSTCDSHGNVENEEIEVDADDVVRIHASLNKTLDKLRGEVTPERLAELLDSLEGDLDELEELVTL